MRALLVAAALLGGAPALACSGDCDGDGRVQVDELVLAVDLALGGGDATPCAAADVDGDGRILIDEILVAVGHALAGCPDDCGDGVARGAEACDDGNRVDGDGCSAACTLEPGGDPCAGVAAFPGVAATAVLVTDAVEQPVHVTAPPLDPHRLFVVEQRGRVRLIRDGVLRPEPFLDVSARVSCCNERGLLSLAFHPDFAANGRLFVNYTDRAGSTVIARFTVGADPDRVDPESFREVLVIDQPFSNHNGGQLAFGPDGYLYVGMGDGGGGGDPLEVAQDDRSLLGKLLRLDVDVEERPFHAVPPDNPRAAEGLPRGLIWAKGLRNPWRFAFDRVTGDLYVADVGQNRFEEVNVQPADSRGGENYGWDIFEAHACFEPAPAPQCPANAPPAFIAPVHHYDHDLGCSITGGVVYRGCALPDLHGAYFFSDVCSAFLRTFRLVDGAAAELTDRTAALAPGGDTSLIGAVASFGEDARGELYIADLGGEIYKVVPAAAP